MAHRFPLAAVLALRQRKEEQEERALAAIATQRGQVQATLERVRHELGQEANVRAGEVGTARNGATHQVSYARYKLLSEAQQQLLIQLETLQTRRLEQQEVYVAARGGREMLTTLQQKGQSAWEAEQERRDQRRLDDLFTARHARREAALPNVGRG